MPHSCTLLHPEAKNPNCLGRGRAEEKVTDHMVLFHVVVPMEVPTSPGCSATPVISPSAVRLCLSVTLGRNKMEDKPGQRSCFVSTSFPGRETMRFKSMAW